MQITTPFPNCASRARFLLPLLLQKWRPCYYYCFDLPTGHRVIHYFEVFKNWPKALKKSVHFGW